MQAKQGVPLSGDVGVRQSPGRPVREPWRCVTRPWYGPPAQAVIGGSGQCNDQYRKSAKDGVAPGRRRLPPGHGCAPGKPRPMRPRHGAGQVKARCVRGSAGTEGDCRCRRVPTVFARRYHVFVRLVSDPVFGHDADHSKRLSDNAVQNAGLPDPVRNRSRRLVAADPWHAGEAVNDQGPYAA